RFGAHLPVVYLPGAAGDVSTRFTRRDQTPGEAERLGRVVGHSVATAVAEGAPVHAPGIDVTRRRFTARVRTSFADAESADPRAEHASAAGGRVAQSRADGRHSRAAFEAADLPATMEIETTDVRIGDRRWLHAPFELASSLGQRLTADDPGLRYVGYADGYAGYLVDAATAHDGHYEAFASLFDLAETERIVRRLDRA
ncbi:MAG: hypothetical protein WA971_07410, partial [Microbacterium sp.]